MSFRGLGKRTRVQAFGRFKTPRRVAPRTLLIQSGGQPRRAPRLALERKYFDEERAATAIVAAAADWTGSEADPAAVNTLFAPVTGADINNRIGRKVDVMNLRLNLVVNIPAQTAQTTTDTAGVVRIVLVQDMQSNAAQLNGEDVLSSGDATQAVNMFRNTAFLSRFRILKDKIVSMQDPNMVNVGATPTTFEQNGLVRRLKMAVKFHKPVRVTFNSTNGGTIADIVDNSFHVLAIVNSGTLAPTLAYKCRTTFVDP